jgi:hypothetical protein
MLRQSDQQGACVSCSAMVRSVKVMPVRAAVLFALCTATGRADAPAPRPGPEPPRSSPAKARPAGANALPLAQRLCDALHALPAKRKSECCGASAASLAELCSAELGDSLRRGASGLDAAAVLRCAQETARQLEGCDWVTPLSPPLPDACRNLVQGKLKAGSACRSSLECPDGLRCRGVGPDQNGVCAGPAAARTRCEVSADNLATFARAKDDPRHRECDGLCIKGECLPFTPTNGTCQSSAQCTPGLHCVAGRCQDRPLPKLGESCAANTSCAAGSSCQEGECRRLKNAGEACTRPAECRALACEKASGAVSGKCGEPCAPARAARETAR